MGEAWKVDERYRLTIDATAGELAGLAEVIRFARRHHETRPEHDLLLDKLQRALDGAFKVEG